MWRKWAFICFTCWLYFRKAFRSTYRLAACLQTRDRSKNSSSSCRRRRRVWHGPTPCIWCWTASHVKPAWCWPSSPPPSKDNSQLSLTKIHTASAYSNYTNGLMKNTKEHTPCPCDFPPQRIWPRISYCHPCIWAEEAASSRSTALPSPGSWPSGFWEDLQILWKERHWKMSSSQHEIKWLEFIYHKLFICAYYYYYF